MAYQARRKSLYTEDFELAEEDGTVVHTLHVALDPDTMAAQLSKKQLAFTRALHDAQTADPSKDAGKCMEVMAGAVRDVLEAVFGQEGARTILEFYGERYIELCQEVLPFINQVVVPKVRKMGQESRKAAMRSYDRPKKSLFGRN